MSTSHSHWGVVVSRVLWREGGDEVGSGWRVPISLPGWSDGVVEGGKAARSGKGRWRTLKGGHRVLITGRPSVSAMKSGVARYLGVQSRGKVKVLGKGDFDDRFGGPGDRLHGGIAAITTSEGTFLKEGFESDGVHEMVHQAGFMPKGVGEFLNEGMTQAAAKRVGGDMGVPVRDTYGKETRFVERYILPSVGVGEREFFQGYARAKDKGKYVVDSVWKAHGDRFSNVEDWGADPRGSMLRGLPGTLGTDMHLRYLVDEMGVGSKARGKGRWVTLPDGRRVRVTAPKAGRFGGGGRVPSKEGKANRETAVGIITIDEGRDAKLRIVEGLAEESGVRRNLVGRSIGTWLDSSSESEAAVRMQVAASKEFALDMPDYVKQKADRLDPEGPVSTLLPARRAPLREDGRRALLRTMYERTQERFREGGLSGNDVVTLSRGVALPASEVSGVKRGDMLSLRMNPLSSWSPSSEVAAAFASERGKGGLIGIVLEMDVPISAIASTVATGFGSEGEFVVLGVPSKARVADVKRG